ncbi:EamA family transporter [Photobacterium sp. GJ3]|uniref:DMT family transporter n=1 Tax=Photobacterium sp. GJ3 TaxID=2829502 RepID=UPI001B8CB5AA|nr:EamA family transporter [Photobacterium sp. GJ3]QUJ69085.1 EamA family transporter [Photobacterium sp. GJ3]
MNILFAMIPAFLWGTTYAATQYTLPDWPPILLGALRALPAGLLLLLIRPSLPTAKELKALNILGIFNIAIFFTCIFIMALTLPSAVSGVGMISVPVFAMIFHWIMARKKPTGIQMLSGGLLVVLAWVLFNPSSLTLNPIGLMAMLGAIVCLVLGSSLTKQLASEMHWWKVLTWQLIIGGSLLLVLSFIHAMFDIDQYRSLMSEIRLRNFLGLAWLIIFTTAIAYGLYVWLLQRMTVVEFTFGGIANPIAGILSGMLLVGEVFSATQYTIMGLMIATSLLPQIYTRLKQPNFKIVKS